MTAIDTYRQALQATLYQQQQDIRDVEKVLNAYQGQGDSTPLSTPYPTADRTKSPAFEAWQEYQDAVTEAARSGLSGPGLRLTAGAGSTSAASFETNAGYRINVHLPSYVVEFYEPSGNRISQISGDPHVFEGSDGAWDWHFGGSSTFILPDGSKIYLTTAGSNEIKVVVGVDVQSGAQRGYIGHDERGLARPAAVGADRALWDEQNLDWQGNSGGVFALQQGSMQWAKLVNGEFYDVANEAWEAYLRDPDVDTTGAVVQVNDEQRKAMQEKPAPDGPAKLRLEKARKGLKPYAALTVGELKDYLRSLQSGTSQSTARAVSKEIDRLDGKDSEEQRRRAEQRAWKIDALATLPERIDEIVRMVKKRIIPAA